MENDGRFVDCMGCGLVKTRPIKMKQHGCPCRSISDIYWVALQHTNMLTILPQILKHEKFLNFHHFLLFFNFSHVFLVPSTEHKLMSRESVPKYYGFLCFLVFFVFLSLLF